jgi:hypothetical protein
VVASKSHGEPGGYNNMICLYIYINVGEKIENHDYISSDAKVKSE